MGHTFGPFTIADNRMCTTDASGAAVPGPVPGYPTSTGYDLTTGFGSPRGPEFPAALKDVAAYGGS